MPHCFPGCWRVGKESLPWRAGWFVPCLVFVVLYTFDKDLFKPEHGWFSFHELTWHFPLVRSAAPSPVTTSPAGPNAKSTLSVENKHEQVCSTLSAGRLVHWSSHKPHADMAALPSPYKPGPPGGLPKASVGCHGFSKIRSACNRAVQMSFCDHMKSFRQPLLKALRGS